MASLLPGVQAEGYARLLRDESPALAALLRRTQAAQQHAHQASVSRPAPLTADHLQRLITLADAESGGTPTDPSSQPEDRDRRAAALHQPTAATAATTATALAEPLTRKEIRVLQLLAEGYSNNAKADKLFVSDSTVRTHLRNINLKLSARSRTQAVACARRLGVIG